MTPAEMKEYKVGQVFEEIKGSNGAPFSEGSILILSEDDGSYSPLFDLVRGHCEHNNGTNGMLGAYRSLDRVKRIYPPELPSVTEEKEPIETITLMGKEYNKTEIEQALADVLPVTE